MNKRYRYETIIILTCLALSGCGRKSTGIVLDNADNAKSIKNFSKYKETDIIPLETEKATEGSSEEQTEKQTEKQTERQTELVTEAPMPKIVIPVPETEEPETEARPMVDYDYSEDTVYPALFPEGGYTKKVSQDPHEKSRSISATNGTKTVTLTANTVSGASAQILVIDDSIDNMKADLLSFNSGIVENLADKFIAGEMNGNGAAFGLKDVQATQDGENCHVVLTKADQPEGSVPGWDETFIPDIGEALGGKYSGNDLTAALQPIELVPLTRTEEGDENIPVTKTYYPDGSISEDFQLSSSYEASGHIYQASFENGALQILVKRPDCADSHACMEFASKISSAFVDMDIDTSFDLASGPYENEKCKIEKTDDGFVINLKSNLT